MNENLDAKLRDIRRSTDADIFAEYGISMIDPVAFAKAKMQSSKPMNEIIEEMLRSAAGSMIAAKNEEGMAEHHYEFESEMLDAIEDLEDFFSLTRVTEANKGYQPFVEGIRTLKATFGDYERINDLKKAVANAEKNVAEVEELSNAYSSIMGSVAGTVNPENFLPMDAFMAKYYPEIKEEVITEAQNLGAGKPVEEYRIGYVAALQRAYAKIGADIALKAENAYKNVENLKGELEEELSAFNERINGMGYVDYRVDNAILNGSFDNLWERLDELECSESVKSELGERLLRCNQVAQKFTDKHVDNLEDLNKQSEKYGFRLTEATMTKLQELAFGDFERAQSSLGVAPEVVPEPTLETEPELAEPVPEPPVAPEAEDPAFVIEDPSLRNESGIGDAHAEDSDLDSEPEHETEPELTEPVPGTPVAEDTEDHDLDDDEDLDEPTVDEPTDDVPENDDDYDRPEEPEHRAPIFGNPRHDDGDDRDPDDNLYQDDYEESRGSKLKRALLDSLKFEKKIPNATRLEVIKFRKARVPAYFKAALVGTAIALVPLAFGASFATVAAVGPYIDAASLVCQKLWCKLVRRDPSRAPHFVKDKSNERPDTVTWAAAATIKVLDKLGIRKNERPSREEAPERRSPYEQLQEEMRRTVVDVRDRHSEEHTHDVPEASQPEPLPGSTFGGERPEAPVAPSFDSERTEAPDAPWLLDDDSEEHTHDVPEESQPEPLPGSTFGGERPEAPAAPVFEPVFEPVDLPEEDPLVPEAPEAPEASNQDLLSSFAEQVDAAIENVEENAELSGPALDAIVQQMQEAQEAEAQLENGGTSRK